MALARLAVLVAFIGSASTFAGGVPLKPSVLIVPATLASRTVCESLVEVFAGDQAIVKLAGEHSEAVSCMTLKPEARTACLVDAVARARVHGLVVVNAIRRGAQVSLTLQLLSASAQSEREDRVTAPIARLSVLARPAASRILARLRTLDEEAVRAAEAQAAAQSAAEEAASVRVSQALPLPEVRPQPATGVFAPQSSATSQPVKSHAAAVTVTVLAVAAVGAAATLGALTLSNAAHLRAETSGVSELSFSQAVSLRDTTNLEATLTLGIGIGALVAGLLAGVLWAW